MIVFSPAERDIEAPSFADNGPHRADLHSLLRQFVGDVFGEFGIHGDRAFISPVGKCKEGHARIGVNGLDTAFAEDTPVVVKEEPGWIGIDLPRGKGVMKPRNQHLITIGKGLEIQEPLFSQEGQK